VVGLWRPLKGTWFPLLSFPGTPVPGSGFFRPFRDWFTEKICGRVVASPKGDLVSVAFLSRHSRAGLWILPSRPGLVCGKDLGRVVVSPKGDWVSVAFLPRHSRAGLWVLPSLSGLVCGKDLWPGCGVP
jgi:hypothetical protein